MPLYWEQKTIAQAISEKETKIHLTFEIPIYFSIDDEIFYTGNFDLIINNDFVTNTLSCDTETTLQTVCIRAINHIFKYRHILVDDNFIHNPMYATYEIFYYELPIKRRFESLRKKQKQHKALVYKIKHKAEAIPLIVPA